VDGVHGPAQHGLCVGVGVRVLAGLFLRAFVLSLLQSAGVVLIAQLHPASLVTAFNYLWIGATRQSVDYRQPWTRTAYGLGGMCGCLVTLLAAWHRIGILKHD
jgi:hypothetical protein